MSPITVQSEYFHCINGVFYPPLPQQVYQLDSFIEFIGTLPTVTTRENRIRVHYVRYQKLNDTFMHFDDARINRFLLHHEYKVNLLFYKRANTPAVNWPMDLELIPMYNNPPPRVPPSKAIEPKHPDPSLRPPLITPSTSGTSRPKPALKDETPTCTQPSRSSKKGSMYYPDDSSSSESEDMGQDASADEYTPPNRNGMCLHMYFSLKYFRFPDICADHAIYKYHCMSSFTASRNISYF